MVRKEKLFIALTWFLVVMSVAICANATAGPRLQASDEHMELPAGKLRVAAAAISSDRFHTCGVGWYAVRMAVAANQWSFCHATRQNKVRVADEII
ncbi:conserved hypothetical protein [Ricinus communis]|uniref:Uncharacterized protein n=1 Tax=Ricinus communis TaxID=3988 RepID=B9SGB1_RICCO|nr:conserved hypothetical protein [Ricinus communis]